jgi:hypothetical protein
LRCGYKAEKVTAKKGQYDGSVGVGIGVFGPFYNRQFCDGLVFRQTGSFLNPFENCS